MAVRRLIIYMVVLGSFRTGLYRKFRKALYLSSDIKGVTLVLVNLVTGRGV